MKMMCPQWLARALRYEQGFLALAWRDIKRTRMFYLKALATGLVLVVTLNGLTADFGAVEGYRSGHGIRAALCALAAAALVFIGMVSTSNVARPWFDSFVRVLGTALAFLAGGFWLLAETGGNIQPYLLVVISASGASLVVLIFGLLLGGTFQWESAYQRRIRERDNGETAEE